MSTGKADKLKGFEIIKAVHLEPHLLSGGRPDDPHFQDEAPADAEKVPGVGGRTVQGTRGVRAEGGGGGGGAGAGQGG